MRRFLIKKIYGTDPVTGRKKVAGTRKIPFYNQTLRTTAVLKPGILEYSLFKKEEPAYLRNYTGEKNPFPNGEGEFIALSAQFLAPDQSTITIDNTTIAILKGLSLIRNSASFTFKIGDDIVAKDMLSVIMPPIPWLVLPYVKGNPNDVVFPPPGVIHFEPQSSWMERSKQKMISFKTPLPTTTDEGVDLIIKIEKDPNIPLPPGIDNYLLEFQTPANIFLKSNGVER
ncbi:conserved hypothetical protein [Leptospira interrogans serovar Manilae]|uniref:Uncharacterized protein n=1 Tax=Leptospira interrogans serovar Manilae TaxID=214675 RepID=A0AAQ1P1X0_LEPIR|nr:hypothetical protein [Leptospira interrogans]AKP25946.1 hypothetical protein LIMLP_08325 [Leptospira interrogans serovar Manilae]AKP29731.1 hypothetical protein LIMHP_08320 [Leptospira interrogans serovar Manilae]EYU62494.1 hypothetical protein CI00_20130 [Leptospira interrogans serovar Manilae]SOR63391.1 conserved hypothetical protein [Leptospira interrogans serovar Manilae]